MTIAAYGTFLPVYFNNAGFSKAVIGILLALGPFVSIIAQPIWGTLCDRTENKNWILKILLLGSVLSVVLYPWSNNLYYILFVITIYTFFQSPVNPISDAITLEHLASTGWKFGPIRLAGTIGFAFMSIIAGYFAKQNIKNIFFICFIMSITGFFILFRVPKIDGYKSNGKKLSIWRLFKNYELVIFIAFNFVIQATFGFYNSFFPIHFSQLGADNSFLGLAMFITSGSEIPFLLFADKILKKLGIRFTLIVSACIIASRWMLLYFITDINILLIVNGSHGLTYIVFSFCMVTYISKNVPDELRASGQILNSLLCTGLARMLGSIFGGFLSNIIGIKQVFLYMSFISIVAIIVFGSIFLIQKHRIIA